MMMIFVKYYYLQGILGFLALLSFLYYSWVSIIRRNKTKTTNTSNKEASYNKGVVTAPPPDVAGAWPVVGHLPQLVGPKQPLFRVLGDMADKYGPIFMVRFGMYPTLVVSSWEMAKECFTTNDRVLASRPASAASKYLTYDYAMFGFTFYGPYWREIRKISTIELLSIRRLELLKHVPFTEIDTCIRRLYRLWMKNHRNGRKQLGGRDDINDPSPSSVINNNNNKVDMSQLFGDLTLNVVLKLVAGKRLLNINDNTEEDKDSAADQHDHQQQEEEAAGRKLHETIVGFFKMIGVSAASDALPFLGWLDLDGQKRNMKKISKEMDLIAQKWLEEHRQKRSLSRRSKEDGGDNIGHGGGDRHENDFIDVLLSVFEDGASDHDHLFMNYSRDTVIKATALVRT
ncbi:Cytochrome P450 [Macleaya cordata]|uniref:Cytochrome P450 n=1 Tax=Macleaya cordata TaxID=56857 RepID=A0A200QH11_MACCD|nr:Cytochrome P450 [Macleaya cordata]